MKLTGMDLPAAVGHRTLAGWNPEADLFPMRARRQSMGAIKGVLHNDCDDTEVLGMTVRQTSTTNTRAPVLSAESTALVEAVNKTIKHFVVQAPNLG